MKEQTKEMLENRRSEVRRQREEIIRERAAAAATSESSSTPEAEEPLPSEDDIEEMDIEPPGWEAKGHWVLTLDLMTGMQEIVRLFLQIANIMFRFHQAGHLLCLLFYPSNFLRFAYPYYA